MDLGTCTVETGLLKKKPCGQKAVSKCANCEQSLCAKHAVGQMSAGKKIFLCPECAKAWKQQEKTLGEVPPTAVAGAAAPKPAAGAAPKPAAAAPKPAAVAPKPAAAAPAAKKEAPKEEEKHDDDAPLEFTPSKPPEDKK